MAVRRSCKSLIYECCVVPIWPLSDMCSNASRLPYITPIRDLSDAYLTPIWRAQYSISHPFLAPIWHLSDTYLSDTYLTPIRHLSNAYLTPTWHLSDTYAYYISYSSISPPMLDPYLTHTALHLPYLTRVWHISDMTSTRGEMLYYTCQIGVR